MREMKIVVTALLISSLGSCTGFVRVTTSRIRPQQPSCTDHSINKANLQPVWRNALPHFVSSSSLLLSSSSSKKIVKMGKDDTELTFFQEDHDVTIHTFRLEQHRPLGCTIEESLSDNQSVFLSTVKEGGYAQLAGLCVGDVLVAMTGTFGAMEDVHRIGMDQIRTRFASRMDQEALELRIARGTGILQQHEAALTELCANPIDDNTEQCMLEFLKGAYYTDNNQAEMTSQSNTDAECNPKDDKDCVLDDLYSIWAEELLPSTAAVDAENVNESDNTFNDKPQVKPWSTRTSPSGTWVLDPGTGKMRNIDS